MSLFSLANGATLRILSAKELIAIPVWKNNRIIDHGHVAEIARDVNPRHLDHGYHIAIVSEEDAGGGQVYQHYIIDGQHRRCVLRKYFEEEGAVANAADFPILVFERRFGTEGELIEYFNAINKCKPVQPWVDENLVLNNCVRAIEDAFENRRTRLIRPGGCHRPYMSADRLREGLRSVGIAALPSTAAGVEAFAARVKAWNDRVATSETYAAGIRSTARRTLYEKGKRIGFVLAFDERFPWLKECLN